MPLIPAGLLARLNAFFPDTVSIQAPDLTGTEGPLANHQNLACRIYPLGQGGPVELAAVQMGATHHIKLQGYYPLVTKVQRAVNAAGIYYNILDVRHDGSKLCTDLFVQSTTPGAA